MCFTVDPVSGNDRIVVNANYGLGESVVGGYATPDTYLVDRRSFAPTSQVAGQKKIQVVAGLHGVETTEVPASKQGGALPDIATGGGSREARDRGRGPPR